MSGDTLTSSIQIVEFDEIKLVGLPVTVAFESGPYENVAIVRNAFFRRRNEIQNTIHPDRYVQPWFCTDALFTYLCAMEVSDLSNIPEGMIGFRIPSQRYAAVHYDGPARLDPDPYGTIDRFLDERWLEKATGSMPLEFFTIDAPRGENNRVIMDLYVPVR